MEDRWFEPYGITCETMVTMLRVDCSATLTVSHILRRFHLLSKQ